MRVFLDPVNDAPVAGNDGVFEGTEDTILRVAIDDLLENDSDIDGDSLRIIDLEPLYDLDGNPIGVTPRFNLTFGKGNIGPEFIEFEPLTNHFGFAGFTYTVTDDNGGTAKAEVELFFNGVNDAPSGTDDSKTVRLTQTAEFTIAELLDNDRDPEGDNINFLGLHSASGGTLDFNQATGEILFTPDALGDSTFQYDVEDDLGASATFTVTVTAIPLNDPPRANNDFGFETLEDQTLIIDPSELLANDSDPNGDLIIVSGLERFPQNGKVDFTDDGMIRFRPRDDYNGPAGFVYEIADEEGLTDTARVFIDIVPSNDGPVLFPDVTEGFEDLPMTFLAAEAFGNDYDPEGDVLFFTTSSVLGVITNSYANRTEEQTTYEVQPDDLATPVTASAALADGTELPEFLSLDPVSLVLVADPATTPTSFGPLDVEVSLTSAETGLVVETNIVTLSDADTSALTTDGVAAGFTTPDVLVVSAVLGDGTELPDFLSFDPLTWTLTADETLIPDPVDPTDVVVSLTLPGTPPLMETGTISITDADRDVLTGDGIKLDLDVAVFDVSEGTFDARLFNYRPLPEWLAFDEETLEFSFTDIPPEADADVARVRVVFTPEPELLPDNTFASSEGGFEVEFVIDPAAGLDPAVNDVLQPPEFFAAQGLFAFPLGTSEGVTATKENLADLPDWMLFDEETLSFTGTPPELYVGAVPVRLDVAASADGSLPDFSLIADVVIDEAYSVAGGGGFSNIVDQGERIILNRPEDFNGAYVITYSARDEKDGLSEEPARVVVNVLPQPEAPDAVDDFFAGTEDVNFTINLDDLLTNDFDDDGDSFRVTGITQPDPGTLEITAPTQVVPVPAALPVLVGGVYSATLADGTPLPEWMSIDAATGEISADVPLDIQRDFEITVNVDDGTTTASETITQLFDGNAGVELTFIPEPAFSGEVVFSYEITDDLHGFGTANVTIDLAPVNDPPVGVDDEFTTLEATPLVLDFAQVLANDTDIDGDTLTVTEVLNPSEGTVEIAGGQIVFTPRFDWDGVAGFDYVVSDGSDGSDTARVTVNVTPTNRAPIAGTDTFAGEEDTPFVITRAELLANHVDPENQDADPANDDVISFVRISDTSEGVRFFNLPNGDIQILTDLNFNGIATLTYEITDGRLESEGTIEVNFAPVNDAPEVFGEGGFTTVEDTPRFIDLADLIANDTDPEGDPISVSRVFDGDNGTAEIVGNQAVFTPRADYFGNAQFFYGVVDDQGAEGIGVVTLTVLPAEDAPIAVGDIGITLNEDSFLDIDPATLLANDYDPDGGPVSFVGFAANPFLTDLGNGLFRFEPDANANGTVTLQYTIADESGLTANGTARIDVLPVDDAPVAFDDTLAGTEDQVLIVPTTALTANDVEVDGEALIVREFLNFDGVSVAFDGLGQIVITPDADRFGVTSFDYVVEDGSGNTATAEVKVNLAGVNDAPVVGAVADIVGTEDEFFSVTLDPALISDIDTAAPVIRVRPVDGSTLPAWLVFDAVTLTLSGQPPANFNGVLDLELAVFDGLTDVAQPFSLTIEAVNDAPVPADDAFNGGANQIITIPAAFLLANDVDVDGDTLTIVGASGGAGFTAGVTVDGDVEITRDPALGGQISVGYTVTDGDLTGSAEIIIDLDIINQAPVIGTLDDIRVNEDNAISFTIPDGLITDPDGDSTAIDLTREGGLDLPDWLSFDGLTGTLSGQPPADFNGTIALEVSAFDGQETTTAAFALIVDPVNDAPRLSAPFSDRFIDEDQPFDLALQTGLVTDPEGDALTYSVALQDGSALPSWIAFDPVAFALTGLPPANFNGVLDLQISVSDGTETISDVFLLTVNAVNDVPELLAPIPDYTTDRDGNVLTTGQSFTILTPTDLFFDADGDDLAFNARLSDGTALPGFLNFDGVSFFGTPTKNEAGPWEVELRATDGVAEVSDIFTISFVEQNTAPEVGNDSGFIVTVPNVIDIDVADLLSNDSDFDGDVLEIVSVRDGANGEVRLDSDENGAFVTYIPELDYEGDDVFYYSVSDGETTVEGEVEVFVDNPFQEAIVGGDGNDNSFGGAGDDLIDSGAGDDNSFGGTGSDVIYAGEGNDNSFGGSGGDAIYAGEGNDRSFGGSGGDAIYAGDGDDLSFGGGGSDAVYAGEGDDRVFGGGGGDALDGGDGADLIFGGAGGDIVNGGAGDDLIFGGGGNDTITAGQGDDRIFGGAGRDQFFYSDGDGSDRLDGFQVSRSGRRSFIPGDEIHLDIEGIDDYDQLLGFATQTNNGVLFDFGDGDELFLAGTRLAALDRDQFTFF
ncbi:MAG: tandem-95 repeat protein [Paracoccaceae bacterium]